MEPPTKRARFSPAPFENCDDPEADELNERPEEVNARRDPAVQLERSRAFAAFKLKSAFERIFEKYEKDFTGVGDEIDLRTGEIVVDNGHVQSLKDAQLGGAGDKDGEGSEDETSEAGSLNDEERMLRGKVDDRLSRVGQHAALTSMAPGIGPPPFLAGGWLGPPPMMGGAPGLPGLSGMMYPGQMNFVGFPMQYGTPASIPTTDPTWRTPELPPPSAKNALATGEVVAYVKKKAARLSLSAAREQDGGDEDDIFLDSSAIAKDKRESLGSAVRQKLLLPRPPPEKASVKKKKRPPGMDSKQLQETRKLGKQQKNGKTPANKKALGTAPTAEPYRTPEGISSALGQESIAPTGLSRNAAVPMSTKIHELIAPSKPVAHETTEQAAHKGTEKSPLAAGGSWQSTGDVVGHELDREHPNVYVNLSDKGEKLTSIPRNQVLRVEIPTKKPPDVHSFRIVSPGPNEAGFSDFQEAVISETQPKKATTLSEVQNLTQPAQDSNTGARGGAKAPKASNEIFSRNIIDSEYAFSDDDEPALPRRGEAQQKANKAKLLEPLNTELAMLREIPQNVSSGAASGGRELAVDVLARKKTESTAVPTSSPTLSLHQDDVGDRLSEPLRGHGSKSQQTWAIETPGKATEETEISSSQKTKRRVSRRMSVHHAASPLFVQSGSKSPTSGTQPKTHPEAPEPPLPTKRRSERPRKNNPKITLVRTPCRLAVNGRISLGQPKKQEIPETSPNAQPVASPLPASGAPAPVLETRDPDPPLSPEEQAPDIPDQHDRAPSPTLTDPTSKPEQAIPRQPLSAPQPATPRTPVKTSKPRQQSPSTKTPARATTTTTTTTTTAKKRLSLLSLLPSNGDDNDDSEEDELSILSPAKPPSGPSRSTPAGHHVRLGLSTTTTATTTATATTTGIRFASSTAWRTAPAAVHTPTARGRGNRSWMSLGGPRTPSSSSAAAARVLASEELVQTPGGTMRRCGEGGFRCEREFCFSCL